MGVIRLETPIAAPPEVCFDLALDVDLHVHSTGKTQERAVAGVTKGRLGSGDWVTWEAVHFGLRQRLTVRITEYQRPHRFVDEMAPGGGAFRSLIHTHEFVSAGAGTLMRDTFAYTAPLGPLGRLVDRVILERYLHRFLLERMQVVREAAETAA